MKHGGHDNNIKCQLTGAIDLISQGFLLKLPTGDLHYDDTKHTMPINTKLSDSADVSDCLHL